MSTDTTLSLGPRTRSSLSTSGLMLLATLVPRHALSLPPRYVCVGRLGENHTCIINHLVIVPVILSNVFHRLRVSTLFPGGTLMDHRLIRPPVMTLRLFFTLAVSSRIPSALAAMELTTFLSCAIPTPLPASPSQPTLVPRVSFQITCRLA